MKWRLATAINIAIALVTIVTAGVTVRRVERQQAIAQGTMLEGTHADGSRRLNSAASAPNDPTEMRVDDLASVPPSQLYQVLMRSSPDEIAALGLKFNTLPKNGKTIGATSIFFQAWAELDGISALQGALRLNDTGLKRAAASTVVHSVSPAAAPELARFLKDHPDQKLIDESQNLFEAALLDKWSLVDPPAAAKFADDLNSKRDKPLLPAIGAIAYSWGTSDPPAALSWIEGQSKLPESESGKLFTVVVLGWCNTDLQAASAYVVGHLDRPGSDTAAIAIAFTLFDQDPKKATGWLSNVPSDAVRGTAETRLASFWGKKDPAAASHWIETLPRDDQKQAVGQFVATWTNTDWRGAAKWASGLNGDVRDDAIASVISSTPELSRSESLQLATSITDAEQRGQILRSIVQPWLSAEPDAATAWINNSALAKEEKQQLLDSDNEDPPPQ